jgi:hypothetical protein
MAALIAMVAVRLHRLHVWLYLNYLTAIKGKYIGRIVTDDVLSIEQVSATAVEMSGGKLDYETVVMCVKHFLDEAMHQMCDGFGINFHYFLMYPGVGGTFESEHVAIKAGEHEITIRFRVRQPLRDLMKTVEIEVVGVAKSGACIDEFTDVESGAVNEKATPNGQFVIKCAKGKIKGGEAETGICFMSKGVVPAVSAKVTKKLAKNDPAEIIGTLPDLPPNTTWEPEIRTYFSGSRKPLKNLRITKAGFTITT